MTKSKTARASNNADPANIPDTSSLKSGNSTEPQASSPKPRNQRSGELSEAAFVLKAGNLGFHVSRPWSSSERYDFILDSGFRLWRTQLKCTEVLTTWGYLIRPVHVVHGKHAVAYTADDIDVLVAYIVPKDAWYVLPLDTYAGAKNLHFFPDIESGRARWEQHREAWELLRTREPAWQNPATRAALEAARRHECKGRDWRRCLLHAAGEVMRQDRNLQQPEPEEPDPD